MGGILNILSLFEIMPVYLVDILYLSNCHLSPVTNTVDLVRFRGHKNNYYVEKLPRSSVDFGKIETGLQNLAKKFLQKTVISTNKGYTSVQVSNILYRPSTAWHMFNDKVTSSGPRTTYTTK